MITEVNYQQVVDIAAACITAALPIGIIFGLAEKAVNAFLSMAFGEKRIRL